MKLPFIIAAATGAAIAAYIILNTPGPEYATGSDTLEGAARDTAQWGSKKRISGSANRVIGKVKKAAGDLTGNPDLADEGIVDQAAGAVKDAAGQVAQVAGKTIHDLNR
jgi:uncharacterized protein YjbJ (UPF0337 family)